MATGSVHYESDGKSVTVDLTASVDYRQLAYAGGWLGLTESQGESGDEVALNVDNVEWQVELPAAFVGVSGDEVYIDITDLTGHTPDDTAYSKTAGANKLKLGKLTSAQDGNNVATIKVFGGGQVAS